MQVIGLSANEQTEIFKMLAIVLWLGNVQFAEKDDGNSEIADTGVTDFVAYLMEVERSVYRNIHRTTISKLIEHPKSGLTTLLVT